MPDPRQDRIAALIAEAEALEAQAEAAFTARDAAAAVEAYEEALVRREAAELLRARGLPERQQSVTAKTMVSAARAHISTGRSKQARGEVHPLVIAASARGHTLRSLAKAVDTPASIISRALAGTRRIRRTAAQAIENLTGYKATAANWPGGWASE